MRPFNQLIEEIEVDGKKFIPIAEIAKIESSHIKKKKKYSEPYINVDGNTAIKINDNYEISISPNYSLFAYSYGMDCPFCCAHQLQIFQALYKWGFIQVPFTMPSDQQITDWFHDNIHPGELNLAPYCEIGDRMGDIKQALEHFINKKGE